MRTPIRFLLFVAVSVLVSIDPPSAQAPSPDQMTQGAAVFQKVCSSCHGAGGAGGRAASLVDNRLRAGSYEVAWDASRQPSGIYMYKLEAGGAPIIRKMVLTK